MPEIQQELFTRNTPTVNMNRKLKLLIICREFAKPYSYKSAENCQMALFLLWNY